MAMSQRERTISIGVAIAMLILVADMLAIQPYLDRCDELTQDRQDKRLAIAQAHDLFAQQRRYHQKLAAMAPALGVDAATAENRLLHLLHDWEQQVGLHDAAFGRVRSNDEHGLTRLTFEISATGGMSGVASMVHCLETAPIPLRIDSLRLTSAADSGQDLRLDINVSTLCQSAAGPTALTTAAQAPAQSPLENEVGG